MINENEITKHIILGYCASFLLGVAITYCVLCRAYGTDTGATISAMSQQQQHVSGEVGNASTNIREAKNAVSGVSETISRVQSNVVRSEQYARDNAREIDNLSTIVGECRSIAEANRIILEEIGIANN